MENKLKNTGKQLGVIEFLRGIAVLNICLFHYQVFLNVPHWVISLINNIPIGVSVFFVISGFVIPYSLYHSGYTPANLHRFMAKRLLRLYPPFLAGMALTIGLGLLSNLSPDHQGMPYHFSWKMVITNIFLAPEFFGSHWYCEVLWTLAIEIQFYLLIGIFSRILFSDIRWRKYVLFFALIASQYFVRDDRFIFFHIAVFLSGTISALYYIGKLKFEEWVIGLLILSVFIFFRMELNFARFISIPLSCLFILYVSVTERFLNFVGKVSYSFYILHIPLGASLFIVVGKHYIHSPMGINILVLGSILLLIVVSYIWYLLFEAPFLKIGKKIRYQVYRLKSS